MRYYAGLARSARDDTTARDLLTIASNPCQFTIPISLGFKAHAHDQRESDAPHAAIVTSDFQSFGPERDQTVKLDSIRQKNSV